MNLWVSRRRQGLNYQAKDEEQEVGATIADNEGGEEPQEARAADSRHCSEEIGKDPDEPAEKRDDENEK